jgi:hypothetical protein
VKWCLVERDGKVTVTVRSLIETNAKELAEALAAALANRASGSIGGSGASRVGWHVGVPLQLIGNRFR